MLTLAKESLRGCTDFRRGRLCGRKSTRKKEKRHTVRGEPLPHEYPGVPGVDAPNNRPPFELQTSAPCVRNRRSLQTQGRQNAAELGNAIHHWGLIDIYRIRRPTAAGPMFSSVDILECETHLNKFKRIKAFLHTAMECNSKAMTASWKTKIFGG